MTALNNPDAIGYVTRPRLRVVSGGVEIPNSMVASVTSNNHFSANRFQLSFAPTVSGPGSMQWWSQQSFIPVDIQVGLLPSGAPSNATPSWQSLVTGEADKLTIDLDHNQIAVEGRDMTAHLIDAKNTSAYVNQSSSQIITSLAAANGLTAQVATTPGVTGRFWNGDRETSPLNAASRVTTQWDMVVALAKKEGYDAYVIGSTLYFQPKVDPSSSAYIWSHKVDAQGRHVGNVQQLTLDRVLAASKGMTVKVKSWVSKQARAIEKTSSTRASIKGNSKTSPNQYIIQHPDLTEDEAQNMADQTAAELAKHEMLISARLPGDMILTTRVPVKLQGTGTAFDQTYSVLSVTKVVANNEGFYMHANCTSKAATS